MYSVNTMKVTVFVFRHVLNTLFSLDQHEIFRNQDLELLKPEHTSAKKSVTIVQ